MLTEKAMLIFHSDYKALVFEMCEFMCAFSCVHTAAADQPSQERITALPRGDERGQQGTGDSQSVPDLLTTAAHTQKNIYTERERQIDCVELSTASHLNGGGCPCHKA